MAYEPMIYYDRSYAELRESYDDYLRTREQTGALTDVVRESADTMSRAALAAGALVARDIGSSIRAAQEEVSGEIRTLDGNVARGFAAVAGQLGMANRQLGEVSRQLGVMEAEMNFGLARLNDTFQKSAQSICERLDAINDTLNNPRFTEARELYRSASVWYGKGFYEDARNDLLKATGMYKADAVSWRLLGMVYLFGAGELAGEFTTVVDLDAAMGAFFTAAKYITPDAEASGEARATAADIYFYLGLARLFKSNDLFAADPGNAEAGRFLEEARWAFEKSYAYSDKMLEARWNAARCKALQGDTAGALADLEAVIAADGRYEPKTLIDGDFAGISGGDGFKAVIRRLNAPLVSQTQQTLTRYEALRRDFLVLGGVIPGDLAALEKQVSTFRAAYPEPEQAAYVDLYQIALVCKQCLELIPRMQRDRLEERLKALQTSWKAIDFLSDKAAERSIALRRQGAELFRQAEELERRSGLRVENMQDWKTICNRPDGIAEGEREWEAKVPYLPFDIKGTTITKYTGENREVTIPDGATAIGEDAFRDNQLTSVVIPPSVTSIGGFAFHSNQLTSVVIPPGVITIGEGAFCRNQLTSVVIPPSVTSIGNGAFACNQLTSVVIPPSVTSIGGFACNQLTSVVIPPGVTSIGEKAFAENQLTSVVIPPGVAYIENDAFAENQLRSVVISPSITYIHYWAFRENEQLTGITIGAKVTLDGAGFPNGFDDFYNRNGKKAGTYKKGFLGWKYHP